MATRAKGGAKAPSKSFKCEINGQFIPCKSYSGGAAAGGGASGRRYVTELTLVSYMTPDNMILSDAANAVANQGKNQRYTITITELAKDKSAVKTFVYDNCLLTSMDFPAVDASSGELLLETVTFKPEILIVS